MNSAIHSTLLPIHIAAGGLAMVLGAVALSVKKGGTIHRRSGLPFVCSMLVLGATAALLGFRKSPTDGNVFGGHSRVKDQIPHVELLLHAIADVGQSRPGVPLKGIIAHAHFAPAASTLSRVRSLRVRLPAMPR